jgi:hypothetical protein
VKYVSAMPRHDLHPHEIPQLRWEKVSIDILDFGGKNYLVIYATFSMWPEILPIPNESAIHVLMLAILYLHLVVIHAK